MKLISAAAAMVVLVPSFAQASDASRVPPSASFFGIYGLFWIVAIIGSGYALWQARQWLPLDYQPAHNLRHLRLLYLA